MAAVPIICAKRCVAVLTLASTQRNAFAAEQSAALLAALLAPHAAALQSSSPRTEAAHLVRNVLAPLAAELSVQQGRFQRVRSASGEDMLCLNESRGLSAAPSAPAMGGAKVQVRLVRV